MDHYASNGKTNILYKGKLLKILEMLPYSQVNLCGKKKYIHRLVAESFIENPLNLPQVNHKDENKRNNNVNNLEWCTCKYNNNYGTARERAIQKNRGKTINNKMILQLNDNFEIISIYNSVMEASKITKIDNSVIGKVANGKYKKAGGYYWRWCNG